EVSLSSNKDKGGKFQSASVANGCSVAAFSVLGCLMI
ncbi:unnamed protein product, partial [marine sediment metagenome]